MTDLSTYEAIRERLAGLTGPDREVDEDIGKASGWSWRQTDGVFGYWAGPEDFDCFGFDGGLPYFTQDNNAILALIERELPGWKLHQWDAGIFGAKLPTACLMEPDFVRKSRKGEVFTKVECPGETRTIALCLAFIEAKIQIAKADAEGGQNG